MKKKDTNTLAQQPAIILSEAIHDIKNPLTSMTVLIQLLKKATEKKDIEKIKNYIERLDVQTNTVVSLVSLLSDFAKIYFSALPLSMEVLTIDDFISMLKRFFPSVAVPHVPSVSVAADRKRLNQAFEHFYTLFSTDELSCVVSVQNNTLSVSFHNVPQTRGFNLQSQHWENLGHEGFLFPIAVGIIEAHTGNVQMLPKEKKVIVELPLV